MNFPAAIEYFMYVALRDVGSNSGYVASNYNIVGE